MIRTAARTPRWSPAAWPAGGRPDDRGGYFAAGMMLLLVVSVIMIGHQEGSREAQKAVWGIAIFIGTLLLLAGLVASFT